MERVFGFRWPPASVRRGGGGGFRELGTDGYVYIYPTKEPENPTITLKNHTTLAQAKNGDEQFWKRNFMQPMVKAQHSLMSHDLTVPS